MNEELDSKLESIEKEFLVSESQIIKAKATLSDIAYKRNYWKNDNPPDIDETTLNNIEDGIARAYAALNETRQMLTQANERTGIEQILGFGDNLTNAVNQLNTRTGIEQNLEFGDNLTDAVNQLNSNLGAFKTYTYNTSSPCDDDAMIEQLVTYITDKVQAKAMFIVAGLNLNTYYYTAVGYSGEGGYAAISLNTSINTYVLYVANGAIFYKNKVAMGNVVKDYNNQGLSMFLNQNNGVLTIVCNGSSYDYARI